MRITVGTTRGLDMDMSKQRLTDVSDKLCRMIMDLTGLDGEGNELVPCTTNGFELLVALFIGSIDRLTISMARDQLPIVDEDLEKVADKLVDDLNLLMVRYQDHAEIMHNFIRKSAGELN